MEAFCSSATPLTLGLTTTEDQDREMKCQCNVMRDGRVQKDRVYKEMKQMRDDKGKVQR